MVVKIQWLYLIQCVHNHRLHNVNIVIFWIVRCGGKCQHGQNVQSMFRIQLIYSFEIFEKHKIFFVLFADHAVEVSKSAKWNANK